MPNHCVAIALVLAFAGSLLLASGGEAAPPTLWQKALYVVLGASLYVLASVAWRVRRVAVARRAVSKQG